jgi:hypothetical protein
MGEERVSGFVSAKSGSSSVVIYLGGPISALCLELLKALISDWARRCGVLVSGVGLEVVVKKKRKLKPKKKKKKKRK